jgi:multidrug efflux pump
MGGRTRVRPHSPKGAIEDGDRRLQIYTNDKPNHAEDYRPLVIACRDGAAVRLSDVAEVEDSVENGAPLAYIRSSAA